jgi:hypothetical protein
MTHNNNNYLCKYKELLQIGRNKLNGIIENDVELHLLNDEKRFGEMLELNKYVYTYYSTNKSDLTQSIEFIILTDVVDEFIEKIKELGYWYIYKKYNDIRRKSKKAYVSDIYRVMLDNNVPIDSLRISKKNFNILGTPDQIKFFAKNHKTKKKIFYIHVSIDE